MGSPARASTAALAGLATLAIVAASWTECPQAPARRRADAAARHAAGSSRPSSVASASEGVVSTRADGTTPRSLGEPPLAEDDRATVRADALATLRTGSDPFRLRVAVFHLWNSRQVDDEAIDAILAVLRRVAPDDALAARALYAIKDSSRPDVVDVTLGYMRESPSAAVRMGAVQALQFHDEPHVLQEIGRAIAVEPDAEVRRRAVLLLQVHALVHPVARMELESLSIGAENASVRALAAQALKEHEAVITAAMRAR